MTQPRNIYAGALTVIKLRPVCIRLENDSPDCDYEILEAQARCFEAELRQHIIGMAQRTLGEGWQIDVITED